MKALLILLLAVNASAKRTNVTKAVDSDQLKAELSAAGIEANIENCAVGDSSRCFIVTDDSASNATIAAVVAAHSPLPKMTPQERRLRAKTIKDKLDAGTNPTAAELRQILADLAALLGAE